MVLSIYVYGSDVLREKAKEVDIDASGIKEEMKKLVEDMFETMYQADGVGLAAPQVGKLIRVLVVDGSPLADDEVPELKGFKRALINPVIVEESEETVEYSEGCLSIPDIHADVVRPEKIKVAYLDENFEPKEELFDGFACRMVQHEMDHLDGILFVERIAPIRKKMIQSKLNNIKTGKKRAAYKTILK
jgi:peptide deformylase